jgi:hypothetical protein
MRILTCAVGTCRLAGATGATIASGCCHPDSQAGMMRHCMVNVQTIIIRTEPFKGFIVVQAEVAARMCSSGEGAACIPGTRMSVLWPLLW